VALYVFYVIRTVSEFLIFFIYGLKSWYVLIIAAYDMWRVFHITIQVSFVISVTVVHIVYMLIYFLFCDSTDFIEGYINI
jgi:hypothetical protein